MESWLNGLLCLDANASLPRPPPKLPHPDQCELYYVERDTLFSFHAASEAFLQRMVRGGCVHSLVWVAGCICSLNWVHVSVGVRGMGLCHGCVLLGAV